MHRSGYDMHGTKGTECMTCAHSGYDIDLTKVKGTECMYVNLKMM